jgi:hypothetical protein
MRIKRWRNVSFALAAASVAGVVLYVGYTTQPGQAAPVTPHVKSASVDNLVPNPNVAPTTEPLVAPTTEPMAPAR